MNIKLVPRRVDFHIAKERADYFGRYALLKDSPYTWKHLTFNVHSWFIAYKAYPLLKILDRYIGKIDES